MKVVSINWVQLGNADIQKLLKKGLPDVLPLDVAIGSYDLLNHGAILIGYQNECPVAFSLVEWPSTLGRPPHVLHFYAEQGRKVLAQATLDFVKGKGYNTLRAINGSGHPDPVWVRAFEQQGWKAHPVKTVFDFEVSNG